MGRSQIETDFFAVDKPAAPGERTNGCASFVPR